MNLSELFIAEFGDVHLGHPKTQTAHILKSLQLAFPDNVETGKLDLIFIAGDLFDRNLQYSDNAVTDIQAWAAAFLRLCKKRDIVLRVLEGTPSHDWGQSSHLVEINEHNNIGADIKYVKQLSIEFIERFGIHVLYIPDEWKPDPDDIWKDVQQVLQQHQLTQVDFTVMHGSFNYQLPPVANIPFHIPERYLEITKHYVFVGHIHLMSVYDRILAAGSTDRLSHGEEGPKGHWRVKVRRSGDDEIVFVENKNAKLYKTVNCSGLTIEEAMEKVKTFADLPHDSHVRVLARKGDAVFVGLDVLKNLYPHLRWSTKPADDDTSVQRQLLVDHRKTLEQIHIGHNNIEELLLSRVKQMTKDEAVIAQCALSLKEILK